MDYLRNHDVVFVSSWIVTVGPDLEPLEEVSVTIDSDDLTAKFCAESSGVPCHGCVMFRRAAYEAVGGYRAEFYFAQDNDLWNRLIEVGAYGCVGQSLYVLRQSLESISGTRRNLQAQFHTLGVEAARQRRAGHDDCNAVANARQLCNVVLERREPGRDRSNMAVSAYIIGSSLVRRGDVRGRRYLKSAISLRPFYFKAWARYVASFFQLSTLTSAAPCRSDSLDPESRRLCCRRSSRHSL